MSDLAEKLLDVWTSNFGEFSKVVDYIEANYIKKEDVERNYVKLGEPQCWWDEINEALDIPWRFMKDDTLKEIKRLKEIEKDYKEHWNVRGDKPFKEGLPTEDRKLAEPCDGIDGTYERKGKYVEIKSLPCNQKPDKPFIGGSLPDSKVPCTVKCEWCGEWVPYGEECKFCKATWKNKPCEHEWEEHEIKCIKCGARTNIPATPKPQDPPKLPPRIDDSEFIEVGRTNYTEVINGIRDAVEWLMKEKNGVK